MLAHLSFSFNWRELLPREGGDLKEEEPPTDQSELVVSVENDIILINISEQQLHPVRLSVTVTVCLLSDCSPQT